MIKANTLNTWVWVTNLSNHIWGKVRWILVCVCCVCVCIWFWFLFCSFQRRFQKRSAKNSSNNDGVNWNKCVVFYGAYFKVANTNFSKICCLLEKYQTLYITVVAHLALILLCIKPWFKGGKTFKLRLKEVCLYKYYSGVYCWVLAG